MGNGQVVPVSNFEIEPEDVVQINKDQNLMVTLSTNDVNRIDRVKVVDADGVTTELVRGQGNAYPIQNLEVGTYLLDVIVETGDGQAGFETILVVLEPGESAEEPNMVINQVKQWVIVKVETVFVFPPPEEEPEIPLCNENTPPNTTCRDEGDPDDCEPGFVDRGFGCEPEDDSPVCTPDGPPCPPCPEGVEAGWCMDEDEEQDTDDCLRPDGTERFPGCSSNDEEESREFRCQALDPQCGWEGEIPEEDPNDTAKPLETDPEDEEVDDQADEDDIPQSEEEDSTTTPPS